MIERIDKGYSSEEEFLLIDEELRKEINNVPYKKIKNCYLCSETLSHFVNNISSKGFPISKVSEGFAIKLNMINPDKEKLKGTNLYGRVRNFNRDKKTNKSLSLSKGTDKTNFSQKVLNSFGKDFVNELILQLSITINNR